MYIQQFYSSCLAAASYYVESEGEAVVIDPQRDIEQYLVLLKQQGATLKYIFETHFHADFVSGHNELAEKTGAVIVYGPTARTSYKVHVAKDKEVLYFGGANIKVLHTPGHTMESMCLLLYDEEGIEHSVFTGDTLFVGEVGRPDLAVKNDVSKEDLAAHLYDSLHETIMKLPEYIIVYPGHGEGSHCGKNIGKEWHSTILKQKKSNYALSIGDKRMFIETLAGNLEAPPNYFFKTAEINRNGVEKLGAFLEKAMKPMNAESVEHEFHQGAMILDTRSPSEFAKAHIPGSVSINLKGQYAMWVGTLIGEGKKLILVCDPGKEKDATIRLARIGYHNVLGFLKGGFQTWEKENKPVGKVPYISVEGAHSLLSEFDNVKVLDVRDDKEVDEGAIEGAMHIPLAQLVENCKKLDKNDTYLVFCASGQRSITACSLLMILGFNDLFSIKGSLEDFKENELFEVVSHENRFN